MPKKWWLVLAAVALVSGCSKEPAAVKQAVEPSADAVSTFTLVGHASDGRKKWEVRGQSADLLSSKVQLSPVEATAYGDVKLDLTADQGWFQKDTRDVHLEKNVVLVTSDGGRMTTDRFDWYAEKEYGSTDDWVTVTRAGMIVKGEGGVCFPKLKKVRLEKQVTLTIQDPKGETVVTCDGPMEVDYGRRKARFWRNVLVKDAKGTIRSDRLDVALDPKTNVIEKASFFGHVRINQGSQVATAHRANYWQPLGRTSLIGHPKLTLAANPEKFGE